MRRLPSFLASFLSVLVVAGNAPLLGQLATKPKLVVMVVVDQFRYDYLTHFRESYHGGLADLLTKGAVFTDANYIHFPTVTAVGHSTVLSGATPSLSGIVGNEWYDRETGKTVTSVSDSSVKVLGATGAASSPHRLLVSTVGDELKVVSEKSRVIGISLKDRSAILPVGHMANGAYWFDNKSGNFISSTYYFPQLPAWVDAFNQSHPADKYAETEWMGKHFDKAGESLNESLAASPWGNELIEAFAEKALDAEQLGQRGVTDLLSVSFSSNDYVGHALGPDAPQVKDMAIRTDMLFQKLFAALEKKVGLRNVLIVMTADHGVAPAPEVSVERKMPGGRFGAKAVEKAMQAALEKKYGPGEWISGAFESANYLNLNLIREKKLDEAEVERTVSEALSVMPHVFRVYTRNQLLSGNVREDSVGKRVSNGFYPSRSGDIFVQLEPYWLFGGGKSGTTHGTTFGYDTHVPVIFMGPGIKPGKYYGAVAVNDIAPTLATMLGVEIPSGSVGRVLAEMFTKDLN